MKILHYSLGFPPYRSGGLTKFCMDLMRQQNKAGHETALLWPGRMGLFDHRVSVKDRGIAVIDGKYSGIQSFEVINPLPVPYDEGISDFQAFERDSEGEAYDKLLESFQPEVIHVHTLMGLHRSFLKAAKRQGIRCVFTAHDYFPICPKVTLFRCGEVCPSIDSCFECGSCNRTALSIKKIQILQSPPYKALKESVLVRSLRKKHRDRYLSGAAQTDLSRSAGTAADYRKLRSYYHSLLNDMDQIHYNSSLTKSVYDKYFKLPVSAVIGLSHADIADHRRKKQMAQNKLKFTFLGPQGEAKGFFCLRRRLTGYGRQNLAFA